MNLVPLSLVVPTLIAIADPTRYSITINTDNATQFIWVLAGMVGQPSGNFFPSSTERTYTVKDYGSLAQAELWALPAVNMGPIVVTTVNLKKG